MKKINNNLFVLPFPKNRVLFSAFSILLGGLIYMLLRPSPPVFFDVLSFLGISKWLELLRFYTLAAGGIFPDWLVYSLPNGLWAFSYTLLIITIWAQQHTVIKYFWYGTVPVLVFGFEILQYFNSIKGTFSIPDLISGFFGIVAAITIGYLTTKIYNYEKNTA